MLRGMVSRLLHNVCVLSFVRKWTIEETKRFYESSYSPFHSSLPFEHLGQLSVCINQVTLYSILELKQCPRCLVFLKSIQHLSFHLF